MYLHIYVLLYNRIYIGIDISYNSSTYVDQPAHGDQDTQAAREYRGRERPAETERDAKKAAERQNQPATKERVCRDASDPKETLLNEQKAETEAEGTGEDRKMHVKALEEAGSSSVSAFNTSRGSC